MLVAIDKMTINPVSDEILGPVPLTTVPENFLTFWTDSPKILFLQVQAQFGTKRITSSRQGSQIVMLCFLKMLPEGSWIAELYIALRRCLIQIYALSDFQKCQALQSLPILPNQRP